MSSEGMIWTSSRKLASHDGLTDHFDTFLAGSHFVGRQGHGFEVDAWIDLPNSDGRALTTLSTEPAPP